MKRIKNIILSCILILSGLILVSCNSKELSIEFVRFNIGQRQSEDYYLDFTLKFDNKTDTKSIIDNNNFYVKVNEEEILSVSLLYENEETFYTIAEVESKQQLTLRIRVIANIKDKNYNEICIKYNDKIVVEDTIYISNNK